MMKYPNAWKVGICYPFQEIESIPIEKHDLRLDEILLNRTLKS